MIKCAVKSMLVKGSFLMRIRKGTVTTSMFITFVYHGKTKQGQISDSDDAWIWNDVQTNTRHGNNGNRALK